MSERMSEYLSVSVHFFWYKLRPSETESVHFFGINSDPGSLINNNNNYVPYVLRQAIGYSGCCRGGGSSGTPCGGGKRGVVWNFLAAMRGYLKLTTQGMETGSYTLKCHQDNQGGEGITLHAHGQHTAHTEIKSSDTCTCNILNTDKTTLQAKINGARLL